MSDKLKKFKETAVAIARKNRFLLVSLAALPAAGVLYTSTVKIHRENQLPYSEFVQKIDSDQVRDVTLVDSSISGHLKNGKPFATVMPKDATPTNALLKHKVKVTAKKSPFDWLQALMLIPIFVTSFFLVRNQRSLLGVGSLRSLGPEKSNVKFKDVAGIDDAKLELQELVEFLKDPGKFTRLGAKLPKGVLLVGPPGTGKTMLAKAVAGEADVPFYSLSGSEFNELYVGVGAKRVRELFRKARKDSPCIIFIDEIDALGSKRDANGSGGAKEEANTLNELLAQMDGFDPASGIILLAATNRKEILDPALLRPGRFDRHVPVLLPDVDGREQILRVHMQEIPVSSDVDLRGIAKNTPGFSGADLQNLVNEAALLAVRKNKDLVGMADFEEARDKVLAGTERRLALSPADKERIAHHEAGHAIVTLACKQPLSKVTIIPRGRALGFTLPEAEADAFLIGKDQFHRRLAVLYGGREAEKLKYGEEKVTSGAGEDIRQATVIAEQMVRELGMSGLGSVYYGSGTQDPAMNDKVYGEVRVIIGQAEKAAQSILEENRGAFESLARALLEKETLSGTEIANLVKVRPYMFEKKARKAPAPAAA